MSTDVAALVSGKLDLWSSAVERRPSVGRGSGRRISLYGIERLRELVLDLAVRGKLVPQYPNEEAASVLLRKLRAEKSQISELKDNRQAKEKRRNSDDQRPFPLPDGWIWTELGELTELITSGSRDWSKYLSDTGAKFITMGNLSRGSYELRLEKLHYVQIGDDREGTRTSLRAGDLLISITGDVGNMALIPEDFGEAYINQHTAMVRLLPVMRGRFIPEALRSPLAQRQFNEPQRGVKNSFRLTDVQNIQVPLPPLAEQRRIVARVDELMALCDALEVQSASALEAHQTLVETLLAALVNAADAADVGRQWERLQTYFDTLFTTEASVDALKQRILELAVRGRLVHQDPRDEPAVKLLKAIAARVQHKRARSEPVLSSIDQKEVPFSLPENWSWARFGLIAKVRVELVRSRDFPDAIQIAPDVIEKGTGKLLSVRSVVESGVKGPNSKFYIGQILYSKIRPSLSKAVIAECDGLCSADMYPLDAQIDTQFLLTLILSEVFLRQVRAAENRIKMPKLNQESLSGFVVPVPPLAEQKRIVAKVDELLALCDALKARFTDAAQTGRHLADAIVERTAA